MQYLFGLAIAPIIILLSYIKKKDPNPEPKDLLKKIFIFGCLAVIPVFMCEMIYGDLFSFGEEYDEAGIFADVFFGVALVEEFFKWIVVYAICFKSKHFDETYDAIVYAAYSALAFACIENLIYVFLRGGFTTGVLRAFTAVPGHLCDGIIMGYFVGKARVAKSQGQSAFPLLFCSLFLPTLTHCIYDYLLEIEAILVWLVFFVGFAIYCFALVKRAAKNNVTIADGITAQPAVAQVAPVAPQQPQTTPTIEISPNVPTYQQTQNTPAPQPTQPTVTREAQATPQQQTPNQPQA